jgi:hypothetical protein
MGTSGEGARFTSPAAGISLVPPAGWKTLAAREVAPGESARLPDDRLIAALRPLGGKALVELAKHAEPYADLNPTIQVNLLPLGGFAGRPLPELLSTVTIPLRRQHPDLELRGTAKPVKVSGMQGLAATVRYSVTVGGRTLPVRSRIWVVPRGGLYFVIGMTDPPQGPDVAEREFAAALASIRIER